VLVFHPYLTPFVRFVVGTVWRFRILLRGDQVTTEWMEAAQESSKQAVLLLEGGYVDAAPLVARLALKNALTAHAIRNTRRFPLFLDELEQLAEYSGLAFSPPQISLLQRLNGYTHDGIFSETDGETVAMDVKEGVGMVQWLKQQL